MATVTKDRLLTTREAAELLGLQEQTLAAWRMTAKNLPYVKVGRSVKYRLSALEAFLEKQTISAS